MIGKEDVNGGQGTAVVAHSLSSIPALLVPACCAVAIRHRRSVQPRQSALDNRLVVGRQRWQSAYDSLSLSPETSGSTSDNDHPGRQRCRRWFHGAHHGKSVTSRHAQAHR